MEKILITGAAGQLGVELTTALASKYGASNILASDINSESAKKFNSVKFLTLDATDSKHIENIIVTENITQIYHLAAILSAKGEDNPLFTWDLNMRSLLGILEAARKYQLKIFWPSSIAVFGNDTPRKNTPQNPRMIPGTVYGISKQAGEQWCNYYAKKFKVDVRSLRYPGLISYSAQPGGGTTDYAVDIFYKSKEDKKYTCFLSKDTRLPMMYMPDAIRATLELMEAPASEIKTRTSYNVSGVSFTPAELAEEINKHIADFKILYEPDFRQHIADSWPQSINDEVAEQEWGWKPKYDLKKITIDMLKNIKCEAY
ncbi:MULTISPECIES: NAD-dependent epimerase/dehydratase family protein [Salegentibacter]|uniref:Nucleoside-diphosphate-sugar epimerase n=1 Tax=Salegentibacter agarivorans TaxID=345907 RepID=A0A1I2JWA5_9FLAO|nr:MULTISPECIES: NAD-dependent epimerase/dehydratase family protein [Salegentibacter]APS39157.1 NAD-dependent epimerase [Salegentibacter sp. T436]SFF58864.1 Nucleoside-diphosphate-sugar epimerase [Salegentibacter agarivorans]|tara:strand:+ start:523 stop:1467 length:945 start_codon:yes stop_codon:yes gene_type:complete